MKQVGLTLIAPDRPGIVSTVVDEILTSRWTVGELWARTRCDTFFMAVELRGVSKRSKERTRALEALTTRLEAHGLKTIVKEYVGGLLPYDGPADFVANITIEGERRVEILQKTVTTIAKNQASVTAIDTEASGPGLRFTLRSAYADDIDSPRLRDALAELSVENSVEFITEPDPAESSTS